jgi:nucleotide-binding universal stress UspA family protein
MQWQAALKFTFQKREVIIDTSIANGIISYAQNKKVDLILVGAKGTSGLEKFMLGGVATKVTNHAHCSVVTIR